MRTGRKNTIARAAIAGSFILLTILIAGTLWMARSARKDTEDAVRAVSLLYLDELAGRREQVIESNMQNKIKELNVAVSIMEPSDLSDPEHLQTYQTKIKQLYGLEKFAFVDTNGLIYASSGILNTIDNYSFDYQNLQEPSISVYNLETPDKKVDIAVPVDLEFGDDHLCVCFMEMDMKEVLAGASMSSSNRDATFCNLYTQDGIALSNTVLGGLAVEDNLLDALKNAEFEGDSTYDSFVNEFQNGIAGSVSFNYGGIRETLSYVPVKGTDWQLTYLIRESVISDRISSVSNNIINKSVMQSLLTILVLLAMFAFIISQSRRNAKLRLENETAEAAARAKQEEMQQRLILQERLLEEEKLRTQQDNMITAMASDYRSVYHVDLDTNDAICYRSDPEDPERYDEGAHFPYYETFRAYGEKYVAEPYRAGFLKFIEPSGIRSGLEKEKILAYRYLACRSGKEYYEMIRAAGVRLSEDRDDNCVHAVGIGFTVIDSEMRETLAQQQALSDALANAEQANRAKTAFLSSMSHEIRTPMNAIIGLDNIALNDPEISAQTREYLEKIGSSADHLLNLINDILDMSRIESGRMTINSEEFSFGKALEQVNTIIGGQCRDKGLDYECRIIGKIDDYYIGDDMKLRQVMINILGNAVKFTPEGGKVIFTVEEKARFDGRSTLQFIIKDTGIGMSPEYLPKIFDAFSQEDSSSTNRYGSTGLGMPITKSLVELMNGTIEVESEKGVGTTFTVTVTLNESDRVASGERDGMIHPHEMSVLVIDDDPVACQHAKIVLGELGIRCDMAMSGPQGLDMVKLHHARREPYNLILVDWKMPEMDGLETTRQSRSVVGHESAIVILTSYNWDDVAEEAREAGVDTFVPKPLFAATVLDEFREAFRKKKEADTKDRVDLDGRRILLAEDMNVNAEIMVMVLAMRGMEAELAGNGQIALDMFKDHEAGYYDAILMDMRMPVMDGIEATRQIRSLDRPDAKEIPIIALTANAFDEDVQRSMQAGLNAHLSKPVEPEALFETLEGLVKTR